MSPDKLVSMANQIGSFFEAMPDRGEARAAMAQHLRNYWDPRMRRALQHHLEAAGGAGLSPFALEALRAAPLVTAPTVAGDA